jgi:hypothetical protein
MNGFDTIFSIVTDGCGTAIALDEDGQRLAEAELPEMDADNMDHWRRACRQVVSELAAKAWTMLDIEE